MYTNILNSLQCFIFIDENMNVDFYNSKFKNQPILQNNNKKYVKDVKDVKNVKYVKYVKYVKDVKDDIYVVRQKDGLFWSFYIMKYGFFNAMIL